MSAGRFLRPAINGRREREGFRFLAEDRLNTGSGLRVEKTAIVPYRTPLFGERYATKIESVGFTSTRLHP
jgi:hypothetical protein